MMARTKRIFGGPLQPQHEPRQVPEPVVSSADAKKFGFENFGNTCYANSVLQALYFCAPFRNLIIQTVDPSLPRDYPPPATNDPKNLASLQYSLTPVRRKPDRKGSSVDNPPESLSTASQPPYPIPTSPPTLFSALRSLFLFISTHPRDKGTIAPKAFIDKLKESKEDFRGTMHQDAHEFLNHLLNTIVEELEEERKSAQNSAQAEDLTGSLATLASKAPPTIVTATTSSNSGVSPQDATLVHRLFEGILTSETRCLTCETVSSRDESFLDLSIDIEQNSSVTACLRSFSASEMLCQRNKFFCDSCCDLQEAEKRMKIKKLPNILALHLKRFKFQEDVQKYIKLSYRVAFPHELRLFNTVDDLENADRLYSLFAIVVHIGNGPHHGHYISIVKSAGTWLVFDDDNVYPIPEGDIPKYYGDSHSGSAYVLYYQAVDIDLVSLGLRNPDSHPSPGPELNGVELRAPLQQLVPSLPPGLGKVESHETETSLVVILPPSQLSVTSASIADKSSNLTPGDSPISLLPNTSSSLMAPPSPSAAHAVLSPVRRGISNNRRPTTAISYLDDRSDQFNQFIQSDSPRSTHHSASSPSLVIPDDPSSIPSVPHISSLSTLVSESPSGKVKDNGKDKVRKTSGWFKRRSFRLGGKSKSDKSTDELPPSPVLKERSPSANWYKTTSQLKRPPSQTAVTHDLLLKGPHLEPPQAITAVSSHTSSSATQQDSSSSGPSVILSSPATTVSSSPPPVLPKSFSRSSQSTDQIDVSPSQKSSLVLGPRSRASLDHHRNVIPSTRTYVTPRPVTANASLAPTPDRASHFPAKVNPPLGSSFEDFYKYDMSIKNGIASLESETSDPSNHANGHRPRTSLNTLLESNSPSASASSLPAISSPVSSRHVFSHPNQGVTIINSPISTIEPKRTKRKLSLTAPMFGIGKKERDKDGRKDKTSPNSFMQRF